MNNQASTINTINTILNSCIQVEEERISRKFKIPRQIHFQFNPVIISKIEQLKESKHKLTLSSTKLTNIRYYALISSPIAEQLSSFFSWRLRSVGFVQSPNQPLFEQSPLTFSTSYVPLANQQTATVVRSVIDLEGKISQQIQQDLCNNPQLLRRIIDAHYWLILQILAQLPLKTKHQGSRVVWSLWIPIAIVFSIVIWYFLPLNYLLKILITCGVFYVLRVYLKYLIEKQLKAWIIYHLIYGFLGKKVKNRKIGFDILSFII